jgi:hypothetical protein
MFSGTGMDGILAIDPKLIDQLLAGHGHRPETGGIGHL